jgi:antitoxin component YwqK of YwqJK toxin-antitoxin module
MKQALSFLLFLFLTNLVNAQTLQVKPKVPRCDTLSTKRKGQRFADFECGKIAGYVDCNQSLELDQDNGIVYKKAEGTQFLQDANKPFSGTCESCFSNGLLERRVKFVNGREEGRDTTKYQSGCIQVIREHIQGVQNGQWLYYHDTTVSILAWEMNYFAGEKHGKQVFYSKKGDTTLVENYQNGILEGVKKKYYPGSKIKEVIHYKKGLMDGEFLYYNQEGKVLEKLNYTEGKKNGECSYFYSDGKMLKTENWILGAKNGEFKTFFIQGHIQTLETWKKGSGDEKEYFSFDVFECPNEDVAKEVYERLNKNQKTKQVIDSMGPSAKIILFQERIIEQNDQPFLKGKKLGRGVNEVYKYKDKFYVVVGLDRVVIAKKEVKDGKFEEYFPNKKIKRSAVYKNDVLIEEQTYDEFGNQLTSFGENSNNGKEDDEIDTKGKKKKKK